VIRAKRSFSIRPVAPDPCRIATTRRSTLSPAVVEEVAGDADAYSDGLAAQGEVTRMTRVLSPTGSCMTDCPRLRSPCTWNNELVHEADDVVSPGAARCILAHITPFPPHPGTRGRGVGRTRASVRGTRPRRRRDVPRANVIAPPLMTDRICRRMAASAVGRRAGQAPAGAGKHGHSDGSDGR
jgi:hypothetical protein